MAYDVSRSSASMAPCVAMIADTPQTDEPTASRAVNFGVSLNTRPMKIIIAIERIDLDGHKPQAQAAELRNVAQQESHAEQHDAEFQPEFVGFDSRRENPKPAHDANRVADDDADENRPQHVFDIRQRDFVRNAILLDRRLDPFAAIADRKQQHQSRNRRHEAKQKIFRRHAGR